MSINFKKAYNKVDRTYLWEVMEKIGLSKRFVEIVKILHQDTEILVQVNKQVSTIVKVRSRIK